MIRSFLLDHEIEAHVLHENAGSLWAGAVADCLLSVHQTDLGFLDGAFSAPRETVTDESEFAASEFDEQDSAPLKFGWDFFLSVALTAVVFVWSFTLLTLLFMFVNAFPKAVQVYDSALLEFRRIHFTDIVSLTASGFVTGLLWAVAILAARLLRPNEHGKFSISTRCFIFLILWFTYNPVLPILWYVRFLFS
jgi:hypothetical protein